MRFALLFITAGEIRLLSVSSLVYLFVVQLANVLEIDLQLVKVSSQSVCSFAQLTFTYH